MGGYRPVPNYKSAKEGHEDYYWGMGNTAEAVANQFKVSREDQDEFAYQSHLKALKAQAENRFQDQIVPIEVDQTYVDENGKKLPEVIKKEIKKQIGKLVPSSTLP